MKFLILNVLLACAFVIPAFAAKPAKHALPPVVDAGDFVGDFYSDTAHDKLIAEVKKLEKSRNEKLKRSPASGNLSPQYRALVNCVKSLKNHQDVLVLLKAVEASLTTSNPTTPPNSCGGWDVVGPASKLPVDYVFVGAQLVPAIELEAIVTRVRDYARDAKLPDAFMITSMRRMMALARVWDQGQGQENNYFRAIRNYFILPQTKTKSKDNIENDAQMTLFTDQLGRRLSTAQTQIKALIPRLTSDKPYFELDTSVIWGGAVDFTENFQFVSFGAPEVFATMASINSALYGINLNRAYKTAGLANALDKAGKRLGILGTVAQGLTAVDQRRILYDENELLVLDTRMAPCAIKSPLDTDFTGEDPQFKTAPVQMPTGVCFLYAAYFQLRAGVINANLGRESLASAPILNPINAPLFDPTVLAGGTRGFQMTKSVVTNLQTAVRECINGSTTRSVPIPGVVGSTREVNICDFFVGSKKAVPGVSKKLFNRPDIQIDFTWNGRHYANDLRAFLPTEPKDSVNLFNDLNGDFGGFKVRDWEFEQGRNWNYNLFSRYYTNVTDAASLREATRSLATSWGGGVVATPLFTIF